MLDGIAEHQVAEREVAKRDCFFTKLLIFSSPVRSTRRAIAVTPVVRVHVRVPVTLRPSFISKFSESSYLDSHSSESIHIWTIGTLEGRLSFHDS